MSRDLLKEELETLARKMDDAGLRLTGGGGLGLVLRTERLLESGERTLMAIPVARATDDIDVFLQVDVLVDPQKMQALREVLDALGYEPIETAQYYQFTRVVKHGGRDARIKFDLLAPPPQNTNAVVMDDRRIRAKGYKNIHAHTAPEAFSIGEGAESFDLHGVQLDVPHPFTYLMLKTHALRDQIDDDDKGRGRKHAYDIYAIVALLTEKQDADFARYREQFSAHPNFVEARRICHELLSGPETKGTLRLREFARDSGEPLQDDTVAEFVSELQRLIGKPSK